MPDIYDVRKYLEDEAGLAVVSTTQADGRVLSSVVNCSVLRSPLTGRKVVAFVSAADAARLRHIRRGSQVTATARRGWEWAAVTGPATLVGPSDPHEQLDDKAVRELLRDIYIGAGGVHEDWDEYDRVMLEEGRTAVLITPDRIVGNG